MSMGGFTSSFAKQQRRTFDGVENPNRTVERFNRDVLDPLNQNLPGARPDVTKAAENGLPGAEQRSQGLLNQMRPELQPRSFDAVKSQVDAGAADSSLRIQRRQRLATLAKQQAQQMAPTGSPTNYQQPQYTYQRRQQGPYANGQVAGGSLGGRYGIRRDASDAWTQLETAYRQVFGQGIPVNEGYRSYEKQVYYWNLYQSGRGNVAAKPGTSLHGSGRALDLGGPFYNPGSPQHRWLQANAPRFGWRWEGVRFGEPWHWEYHG